MLRARFISIKLIGCSCQWFFVWERGVRAVTSICIARWWWRIMAHSHHHRTFKRGPKIPASYTTQPTTVIPNNLLLINFPTFLPFSFILSPGYCLCMGSVYYYLFGCVVATWVPLLISSSLYNMLVVTVRTNTSKLSTVVCHIVICLNMPESTEWRCCYMIVPCSTQRTLILNNCVTRI